MIIIIYIVNIVISIYILVSYITITTNCLDNNPPLRERQKVKKNGVSFVPIVTLRSFRFASTLIINHLRKLPSKRRCFQRADKGQSMQ